MDEYDGHTIDVGYVHVLTEPGGPCVDNCPHPSHDAGNDLRCAACGGALEPSQYGGYIHADDADDTHQPRVTPPAETGGSDA